MFSNLQQKIQTEIEKLEKALAWSVSATMDGIINAQIKAYKKCLEFIEEEILNSEELAHLSQAAKLLQEQN